MKIEPKFDIGQRVFYGSAVWDYTERECPDCLGRLKWTVTAPSGESWPVDCSTCYSYDHYRSIGKIKEFGDAPAVEPRTIGSVRVDTNDRNSPISYMCKETGVGSGSIYREASLFVSEAEARAFAVAEVARVKYEREADQQERRDRKKRELLNKPRVAPANQQAR